MTGTDGVSASVEISSHREIFSFSPASFCLYCLFYFEVLLQKAAAEAAARFPPLGLIWDRARAAAFFNYV